MGKIVSISQALALANQTSDLATPLEESDNPISRIILDAIVSAETEDDVFNSIQYCIEQLKAIQTKLANNSFSIEV